jgi:hypothetical protein
MFGILLQLQIKAQKMLNLFGSQSQKGEGCEIINQFVIRSLKKTILFLGAFRVNSTFIFNFDNLTILS